MMNSMKLKQNDNTYCCKILPIGNNVCLIFFPKYYAKKNQIVIFAILVINYCGKTGAIEISNL